ncbi:RcnB family protein [Sphingomonas sp. CARO-RG-8B-R24-01]|uniref:RcnB family protein n=1 Tax=Sphingomonas sp. CARO-RG-8B-R24-01 TaxID=2914831 RepID=UPI001F5A9FCB|nr:RcnB family protein [Sphingomonas sp. CARO-RG-8B-R24-01]
MKKMIIALLATAAAASPIAATSADAQQRQTTTVVRERPNGTVVTKRTTVDRPADRRWARGQRFDRRYAQNYRELGDWRAYRARRLYAPPRGYHWVRSGNDAVLVASRGGIVGAVLSGAFN